MSSLCRLAERRGRVFQLAHYTPFTHLAAAESDIGIPFVLCWHAGFGEMERPQVW
jgi:hypothetical protein